MSEADVPHVAISGHGAQLARSAGTSIQLLERNEETGYALLRYLRRYRVSNSLSWISVAYLALVSLRYV